MLKLRVEKRPPLVTGLICLVALAAMTLAVDGARASWSSPLDISESGQDASDAHVAVAADGTATAVWKRSDGSNDRIQFVRIAAEGNQIGEPINLSAAGGNAANPRLAVAADGQTVVVWQRFNGTHFIAQGQQIDPSGAPVAAPEDLSAPGQSAFTVEPVIATDGIATIVYRRSNGADSLIWLTRLNSVGTVVTGATPISDSGHDALSPQIAIDPNNVSTVVWQRSNGSNILVQASRVDSAGISTAPVDVSDPGFDTQGAVVGVAPSGIATVAWTYFDGSNQVVQTRPVSAFGAPLGSPIELSAAGRDAENAGVAVGADGSATVVWQRSNGLNTVAQARQIDSGGVPSPTTLNASESGRDASNPRVVVASSGVATIVWLRQSNVGFYSIVQARQIALDGNFVADAADISPTGQDSFRVAEAVAPDGTVTGVWQTSATAKVTVQTSQFTDSAAGISPTALNFGSQSVGSTSTAQAITITNSGTTGLVLSSGTVTGGDASQFALDEGSTCSDVVLAGQSCEALVKFAPTSAGAKSADLSIVSNAPTSPSTIALNGTGVAAPSPPGPTPTPPVTCPTVGTKVEVPTSGARQTRHGGRAVDGVRLQVTLSGAGAALDVSATATYKTGGRTVSLGLVSLDGMSVSKSQARRFGLRLTKQSAKRVARGARVRLKVTVTPTPLAAGCKPQASKTSTISTRITRLVVAG